MTPKQYWTFWAVAAALGLTAFYFVIRAAVISALLAVK